MQKVPVKFKEYEGLYLFVDDECTAWAPIEPICSILMLNSDLEAQHIRLNPALENYFKRTADGENVLELTYLEGWLFMVLSDITNFPERLSIRIFEIDAGLDLQKHLEVIKEAYEDAFADYMLEGDDDDDKDFWDAFDDDDFWDAFDDDEEEADAPDVIIEHVETTDFFVRLWKKEEKREVYGNYKVYCHFGKQQKVADGYEILDDKLYKQILKEGVPLYFQTDNKISDAKSSDTL